LKQIFLMMRAVSAFDRQLNEIGGIMTRYLTVMLMRLIATMMLISALGLPLMAQTAVQEMAAIASSHDAFQLTPTAPAVVRPVVIDATSAFSVSLLAASRTLVVSVVAPDGTRYSVGDPASNNFESGFFPIDTVSTKPGASYLISIMNPPPGTWTLEVSEPAALGAPLEILATTLLNNSTLLVLVGGDDDFPLGTDVRLALVAFEGLSKLSGLSIEARLFRPFDPSFTPIGVTFRDDGVGADETAGDRIYETFVNPIEPGTYQVQVNAIGTSSTGAFRRTAATGLRIVPHNAQITGFTDRGLDDNADGLFDRIGITPSANLTKAGTYSVAVRLRASNGNEIQRSLEQSFGVGTATVEVTFAATDIVRDLGVDGPYSVAEVRYLEVVDGDLVPADIRYDLGLTAPYTLGQLQHDPLRLSGTGSATGLDVNGNGLYDFLEISIGIIADVAGNYNYSTTLLDRNGRELGFRSGSITLHTAANTLSLSFDGLPIGQGGLDGPYFLSNLLVFGAGQSLIATRAFTTPAFFARQFEGFVPNAVFGNISTRMNVGREDNVLIGGFIVTGTQPKTVIVRGIGPSLTVTGALADPVIEVHGSSGELLATNDNWRDDLNQQHVIDSGMAPTNDLESALWRIINPGSYTVVVRGKSDATGIGLFEVYDLDHSVDSKLANVSTRGFVDTGDNVMMGGTIIVGTTSTRVLVRAIGPSLTNFGVPNALQDPALELHDGNGALLDSNDNWRTDHEAEIIATGIPPTNDFESAVLPTLPPGAYTAIVRGVNSTTGVALVEAYQLQ
jgi:hypothetical protein